MPNKQTILKTLDYIEKIANIVQYIFVGYAMFYMVKTGIDKAQSAGTANEKFASYAIGFGFAIVILVFFVVLNLSLKGLEQFSNWLESIFNVQPTLRRYIIVPAVALSPAWIYWASTNANIPLVIRIIFALYAFTGLNAALISIIREDQAKEKSPLRKHISRELFMQDPQMSLVKAFIVVEDTLTHKIAPTDKFSRKLINEAFQGEKSKLKLVIDGTDRTADFRDFLSGAYGMLRNPRHHALVEDDIYTAASIFSVAELLFQYIQESENRETMPVEGKG